MSIAGKELEILEDVELVPAEEVEEVLEEEVEVEKEVRMILRISLRSIHSLSPPA